MPATLSDESLIETGLHNLGCSGRCFVDIAKTLGVSISQGGFAEGLKTGLNKEVAEKMTDVLVRMTALQRQVFVPIDWKQTSFVANVLTLDQLRAISLELQYPEALPFKKKLEAEVTKLTGDLSAPPVNQATMSPNGAAV